MPASASGALGVGGLEQLAKEATDMKAEFEDRVQVHEEFTYVSGVATQVLKCGSWRDLWETESRSRLLFLVIPGNPGLVGFYRTFIQTLYLRLNQQYPVWVISHAGQCKLPHGMEMMEGTDGNAVEDPFGLHGQVEHKLNFLRKNVPKDVKLLLIGHSIGCYIALEIMKRAPELEILRSVLLFPTIERMAQSPQGKLVSPLVCQLRYIMYIPIYLVTLLPQRLKSSLVHFALKGSEPCDDSALMTSMELINMGCIGNVLYLASQEMRKVVERDSSTIKQHLKKLTFYYGASDMWCPIEYYEDMKMEFPDGDIRLCEKGLRHAFVLDSGKEMAEMVTDWVQDDLAKL